MTRHSNNVDLYWSKEEFPNYEAIIDTLSREQSKECSLDYSVGDFALNRSIDSEIPLNLEGHHSELGVFQKNLQKWPVFKSN